MTSVRYEKDFHNIAHLILDKPDASANVMDVAFTNDFSAAAKQLSEDTFDGVIIRSNKKTFFAGGDLNMLFKAGPEQKKEIWNMVETIKSAMRAVETCGKPVVVCINGAALGGGFELCLAAHHRIALSNGVQLGLPEVGLGLLPGGGGVTRMTRLLGLQGALPFLTEGKLFNPQKGQELGLIHDIVDTPEEMLAKAVAFVKANPESFQPWDVKGYKIPGGTTSNPKVAGMVAVAPAMMRNKTKGVMKAPESILCTMVEGSQVDFDSASRIESRYFVELATGKESKNMISAFWYQLNAIKAGVGRPKDIEKRQFTKVGILGAGMMGAGIAWACANRGIACVLKDVNIESAEKGKSYSAGLMDKRISRGRATEEKKAQLLSLITPTDKADDLQGCDLIIEAVFENRELKATVTKEAEAQLDENAVFGSNTSTLPITGLAEASERPENFIGLHFFSPVDKMPLVEIIVGEKTSDKTLAEAYDFVLQIGKTPIVVNDSRGFFTSRVFGTFTSEGMAMLGEGIDAASIENAAWLDGYPVGPLAVSDEVTLTLVGKVRSQTIADLEAEGQSIPEFPGEDVLNAMLAIDRGGRSSGGAFYDYPEGGKKQLWSGLKDKFYKEDAQIPLQDIKDRLLFVQAIDTVRCVDEGIIPHVRDANIGSIFGIGFPTWTGGVLQYINYYGLPEFIARANELAEKYGERFTPPQSLLDMAANNETFSNH